MPDVCQIYEATFIEMRRDAGLKLLAAFRSQKTDKPPTNDRCYVFFIVSIYFRKGTSLHFPISDASTLSPNELPQRFLDIWEPSANTSQLAVTDFYFVIYGFPFATINSNGSQR